MTAEELANKYSEVVQDIRRKPYPISDLIPVLTQGADMLREQAEKLRKYELRNIAQCDRIAILEAQVYGGTTK